MQGEVRLEELTKAFGDVVAVDGIDLHMPPGEFFTLLGPSGCGKTTTLRMIAGFERPTSGRIMLDGTDVAQVPPHKRSVNTVFQSYALFPHLDVADNVAFGLKYQKTKKEERRQQGQEHPRARPPERLRAAQAGAALRRPAAAGRARPRAHPGAARAPARRAARRPRRAVAQGPPGRAEGDPARHRDHVRVRHARPGGGAHDERPDRGDEPGPCRAGGLAARDLRGPRDRVRGRLPRRLQPPRGPGERRRERLQPAHRRAAASAPSRARRARAAR